MRNALRDAELPPPAGGWERLERELGGAAPGPGASETAAPRGSVWRIYWPRIAAAAAVVLLGVVAGDYMLRPDKALENDGNVIASAVGEEATAVTMPQPREAESVQETLARVAGLADGRTAAPAVQRPELLAENDGGGNDRGNDDGGNGTGGGSRTGGRDCGGCRCGRSFRTADGGGEFAAGGGTGGEYGRRASRHPLEDRGVGPDGVL